MPQPKEKTPTRAVRGVIPPKWANRGSFSIKEAAELIGISYDSALEAAKTGDLATIDILQRKRVPRGWLERLLNGEA
jgi:hypothetical protein